MKARTIVAISVVVALAFPATVLALRRTYFGPAASGVNNAGVEISARLKKGVPVKVTRLGWHNVPGACAGYANTATTDEFPSAIDVTDGKFKATAKFNGGHAKVTVTGAFKHQNQRMKGTIRVRGAVSGCSSVDTGVVSWTAKQPAGQK
ncbi:MAG: hypothetical protein QOF37_1077 [Thermoleophilaceae bacterium]|jgi:hypothetical protein|nr:hypothetical protein [Thermoleophilaceae bacterium]